MVSITGVECVETLALARSFYAPSAGFRGDVLRIERARATEMKQSTAARIHAEE